MNHVLWGVGIGLILSLSTLGYKASALVILSLSNLGCKAEQGAHHAAQRLWLPATSLSIPALRLPALHSALALL